MPKFIEMLYDIVNGEEVERGRAIRDMGNFKLSGAFQHHGTDIGPAYHKRERQENEKVSLRQREDQP